MLNRTEVDAARKQLAPKGAPVASKYWRGEYNFAVGLAKGQVKAKGPINKILKLVPVTKPLFPLYKQMTDERAPAASA